MRILFVEDNPGDKDLIEAVLKNEDCVIDFTNSYVEALEKIVSFEPDLIALDLSLTDSQPTQTIGRIRRLSEGRALVCLSANQLPRYVLDAKEAGAIDFIPKTILSNGPELFATLLKSWAIWRSKQTTSFTNSPLSTAALKKADLPTSELMLMLQFQNEDHTRWKDIVYKEFKSIKESLTASSTLNEVRHRDTSERLVGIKAAQDHTNGDVITLKAEVTILKEKDTAETEAKIKKAIETAAIQNFKTKKFVLPKFNFSWRQWTIFGGIAMFLGYEQISRIVVFLWALLRHIFVF